MRLHTLFVVALALIGAGSASAQEPAGSVVAATRGNVWETSIAISPANPRVAVVVGAQMATRNSVQPFRTTDGGRTWQYSAPLGLKAGNFTWGRHGDPVITVDRHGVFYVSTLLGWPEYPLERSGVGVFRSVDDGATWEGPFVVVDTAKNGNDLWKSHDKEWIAVDRSGGPHDGNIYVAWLRGNSAQQNESVFSRSTDGGRTWSEPTVFGAGGGGHVVVGADGTVHVLWILRENGNLVNSRSYDGGVTFAEPTVVVRQKGGTFIDVGVDRSNGPQRGNLYLVWVAGVSSDPTQPRLARSLAGAVMLVRSRDGGATWTSPVTLTDRSLGNIAAFASIAVDETNGHVIVAWQDRREQPTTRLFRLYASRSTDGGATFAEAKAFTAAVSLDAVHRSNFIGDYNGVAAEAGTILAAFSDGPGMMSVAPLKFDPPARVPRRRSVRR